MGPSLDFLSLLKKMNIFREINAITIPLCASKGHYQYILFYKIYIYVYALPRVIEKMLIVRNNVNSSFIFMKYMDAVSLYLLYRATKSRQNNSAFFVETRPSKMLNLLLMPVSRSNS